MAAYFAMRLMKGALDYTVVVNAYPQFQEDIDLILVAEGRSEIIVK